MLWCVWNKCTKMRTTATVSLLVLFTKQLLLILLWIYPMQEARFINFEFQCGPQVTKVADPSCSLLRSWTTTQSDRTFIDRRCIYVLCHVTILIKLFYGEYLWIRFGLHINWAYCEQLCTLMALYSVKRRYHRNPKVDLYSYGETQATRLLCPYCFLGVFTFLWSAYENRCVRPSFRM